MSIKFVSFTELFILFFLSSSLWSTLSFDLSLFCGFDYQEKRKHNYENFIHRNWYWKCVIHVFKENLNSVNTKYECQTGKKIEIHFFAQSQSWQFFLLFSRNMVSHWHHSVVIITEYWQMNRNLHMFNSILFGFLCIFLLLLM